MLYNDYKAAINIQSMHATFCIIWNAAGLWQIHNGLHALGPTASLMTIAVIAIMIGSLHCCLFKGWETAYLVLSVLIGIMATLAVLQGFVRDQSLWPSEFWRFGAIALNLVGVIGAIAAVRGFLRSYSLID